MQRIVLGCSGGFESSIAIPWLAERYGAEVIAVTLDVGQRAELVEIRERALKLGALRSHVIDVRDEFVRDYIIRSLQAGARVHDQAPLVSALARPLVVRKLVDVARMEGATAIAHGLRGAADGARFELAIHALDPSATGLAPARSWEMSSSEEIEYAPVRNIAAPVSDSPYRITASLWGRSVTVVGTDPWTEPPASVFELTRAPKDCPDLTAYVDLEFQAGVPVRANGIEMSLLEMIESFEIIGGTPGVGREDLVRWRKAAGR